jgi:hypothetical protein
MLCNKEVTAIKVKETTEDDGAVIDDDATCELGSMSDERTRAMISH